MELFRSAGACSPAPPYHSTCCPMPVPSSCLLAFSLVLRPFCSSLPHQFFLTAAACHLLTPSSFSFRCFSLSLCVFLSLTYFPLDTGSAARCPSQGHAGERVFPVRAVFQALLHCCPLPLSVKPRFAAQPFLATATWSPGKKQLRRRTSSCDARVDRPR